MISTCQSAEQRYADKVPGPELLSAVQALGSRFGLLGLRVGFRVQGSRFRVQGLGFRGSKGI